MERGRDSSGVDRVVRYFGVVRVAVQVEEVVEV